MAFGLRYTDGDDQMHLVQISGGGRLRVSNGRKKWWISGSATIPWEVYETEIGHTFKTRADAEMVLRNLVTT